MVLPFTVNYMAVLVAAVAAFALGFFWYSPMAFGKQWMKLSGISAKQTKAKKNSMMSNMLVGFISTLVMAYVLANFVSVLNITTWLNGAIAGFWIWLGFVGTVTLGGVLWKGEPVKLWVLNNAHNLLSLAVMGAIIAVWV